MGAVRVVGRGPVDEVSSGDRRGAGLPVREDQFLVCDGVQLDAVGKFSVVVFDRHYADLAGGGDRDDRPVRLTDADGVWCVVDELHAPFPHFSLAFAIHECVFSIRRW